MIKGIIVLAALVAFVTAQGAYKAPGPVIIRPPPLIPNCSGPNEIYLPQGTAPNCDTVCSEIGQPCNIFWFAPPSGCYCLPSYARDDSNVCVPIDQCPITCQMVVPSPPAPPVLY